MPGYRFDFDSVIQHLDFLIGGVRLTWIVMVGALLVALVLGLLAGQMRASRFWIVRLPAIIYIDFFRTTPLLVQLIWVFYAVPILFGVRLGALLSGIIALGLNYGAFFAEIFRAGIASLGRGQREAGLALGMTDLQVARRVTYPQALRRMLPPIGTMVVLLLKDTSLVSIIGVAELTNIGTNLTAITMRPIEVISVVAVIYFVMTYPLARLADYLHHRFASVGA